MPESSFPKVEELKEATYSDYDSDNCPAIDYPSGRLGAVTRKSNQLLLLMKGDKNKNSDEVRENLAQLKIKIDSFKNHCKIQETRTDVSQSDHKDFMSWYNGHIRNAITFHETVENWLDDIDPDDSASQITARSNISRISPIKNEQIKQKIQHRRQLEELEIEEKNLDAKIKFEKLQLQLKKEKQQLNAKYKEEELSLLAVQETCKGTPSNTLPNALADSDKVANSCRYMHNIGISKPEPEIFDGEDITKYKPFKLAFNGMVEQIGVTDRDKYYYLEKYTSKYAKELVRSCLTEDMTESYNKALSVLEKRYGSDILLAQRYLEKLENWPSIRAEDSKALDEFSLFLVSCSNMMSHITHLNQLNSWKEIKGIVMKLPFDMRKQFRHRVAFKE